MKWKLSIIFMLLMGLSLTACDGSDGGSGQGGIITNPDAGGQKPSPTDAGSAGDGDGERDGKTGEGERDAQSQPDSGEGISDKDVQEAPDGSADDAYTPFDTSRPDVHDPGVTGECNHIEDLGVLEVGVHPMQVIYAREKNDGLRTSCRSFQSDTVPEKVFKFQIAQRARIKASGASNYTFELRQDPCGEEASILSCNPNGQLLSRMLPAGMDFYLIVEDEAELGEADYTEESENFFDLEIEDLFGTECQPGTSECVGSGDEVKVCSMIGTYETKTCPTSCTDGACVGDTCDNPIVLSDGAASLQGELTAFTDKIEAYSCGDNDGDGFAGQALGAQDIVFKAPGLQAGQTINISVPDAAEAMRNIVIQRDGCGETAVCEHFGQVGVAALSHEVEEAGDYYVIIDGQEGAVGGSVDYTVSVD